MPNIESLVNKATDATLTADNWEYILDVCDAISASPEQGTKQAMRAITIRLAQKDANVTLRSLALLIAMGANCGSRMQQEIASRLFLEDSLIKRLGDKRTHRTVKQAIAQTLTQLSQLFLGDPSLKPMSDAWKKASSSYPLYFGSGLSPVNPGLISLYQPAPSKPAKNKMSASDRQQEDDDLQRALKMSLQEYEREQTMGRIRYQEQTGQSNNVRFEQPTTGTQNSKALGEDPAASIATVSKVRALYDLISYEPDELSFRKGDVITVVESVYRDWWRGLLPSGQVGIFPLNYVTPIIAKTPAQLREEEAAEMELLQTEAKKVDRLLSLLANPNADENEVTTLYNAVVPLRPKVGKCIDKYGVRKEELLLLNSKVSQEVKEYNELMDSLIALKRSQYNRVPSHSGFHGNSHATGGSSPREPDPLGQPYRVELPYNQAPHIPQFGKPAQASDPLCHKPVGSGGQFEKSGISREHNRQSGSAESNQAPPQPSLIMPQGTGYSSRHPGMHNARPLVAEEEAPPPTLFNNYNPTGSAPPIGPFLGYIPTGNATGYGQFDHQELQPHQQRSAYDSYAQHEQNQPSTTFNTGASNNSTHSSASQYSQPYYTQSKEFLQQQPTSSGFGNQ